MKKILSLLFVLGLYAASSTPTRAQIADPAHYLDALKGELQKVFPDNRMLNCVFHGHSVPAGYFVTPVVNTLDSYPHLTLRGIKERYPYAVVNVIVTAIGGENSVRGAARFERDVLSLRPEVIFIDYALNDQGLEQGVDLERSRAAWVQMIESAQARGISVILLTPTPDQRVELLDETTVLARLAVQIRGLAAEYRTGLVDSYALFQQEVRSGRPVVEYMSQVNHPNEWGHRLVANEIRKFFE